MNSPMKYCACALTPENSKQEDTYQQQEKDTYQQQILVPGATIHLAIACPILINSNTRIIDPRINHPSSDCLFQHSCIHRGG
jgi:hypothetical protein